MDEQQRRAFEQAVERKKEAAKAASEASSPNPTEPAHLDPVQASRVDTAHTQDEYSVRDKNTGKGKKTADKWNQ